MKNNYNGLILNNKQALHSILLRLKETKEDYDIFCESIASSCEPYLPKEINIMPYLYLLEKIDEYQYSRFLVFYKIYLKKSNIDDDPELEDIFTYIRKSIVNLVTFIIAMQYYFL